LIDALESLELFLYRRSKAIVALTPAFKTDLVSRGVPEHKIATVINGADLSRFTPRPSDARLAGELGLAGKFVVGYIGTHGMAHDLGNVLEAAQLTRRDDRIRYLFVGAGAERDTLIARANQLSLDNVVFVPRQPKDAISAYWSVCDVALVHLKDEPVFETVIPSKMFEAMAVGRPILLVAREGEATAIVRREHAGWIVPPRQPAKLAAEITALASGAVERARAATAAIAAAPRYSRERQARDVAAVLQAAVRV